MSVCKPLDRGYMRDLEGIVFNTFPHVMHINVPRAWAGHRYGGLGNDDPMNDLYYVQFSYYGSRGDH